MVVDEQDLPLLTHLPEPAHDPLAAVLDAYPAAGATERIGTSIDRVGQDVMDGVVDGELPVDLAPLIGAVVDGRQDDPLLPEPEVDLADALELGELAEHQLQGLLHAAIRILLDPIMPDLHVADRNGQEQLTALGLLSQSFE